MLGWQSVKLQPSPQAECPDLSFDVLEKHLAFGLNKLLFLALACHIMVMF